ncbi:WW domain-containing oxidoreductase-like isoform X1 [Amphiura filiformis]|uniref:WW domain-containing oxidoreductase-like isoform X1 n=1 Tax=Amphiura filiformis TaxID=82378 RepID=UPI003B211C88
MNSLLDGKSEALKMDAFIMLKLPYGWSTEVDDKGRMLFVDHIKKRTTYTDPRLAFAMEESPKEGTIAQRFDAYSSALSVLQGRDLSKKYAIVTGANSGIGFETARALALHGVHVTLACRNLKSANVAAAKIKKELEMAKIVTMTLDLASLRSVKQFAENYKHREWPLDILICNAATFAQPYELTEDGFETTFQVNHLSHFYLVQLLQDALIKSAPSRVVMVASESHRFIDLYSDKLDLSQVSMSKEDYWPILAYGRSKLCNILFSNELNKRLSDKGVNCNSCHPGNLVYTKLSRNWWMYRILWLMVRPFTKSAPQGAASSVFCATAKELEGIGGLYINHCCPCATSDAASNPDNAKALWELNESMLRGRLSQYTL